MLNSTVMHKFFKNNPQGHINIVQQDCVFQLYEDISFSLDETSITFINISYTDKNCGNYYMRKGNFMIPFNQIIRIEYIKNEWES